MTKKEGKFLRTLLPELIIPGDERLHLNLIFLSLITDTLRSLSILSRFTFTLFFLEHDWLLMSFRIS